jgi:hypothetical protein
VWPLRLAGIDVVHAISQRVDVETAWCGGCDSHQRSGAVCERAVRRRDRGALLDELQRRGYDLLLATLSRIKAEGLTGADAVEAYLYECLAMADQLVAMPLRGAEPLTDDEAVDAKAGIGRAIDDFLAEGRADGSVHDDVSALDVIVCGTLVAMPLPHGPDWSVTARRHLDLFMRGVRAEVSS